jgi:hypothetical protein
VLRKCPRRLAPQTATVHRGSINHRLARPVRSGRVHHVRRIAEQRDVASATHDPDAASGNEDRSTIHNAFRISAAWGANWRQAGRVRYNNPPPAWTFTCSI